MNKDSVWVVVGKYGSVAQAHIDASFLESQEMECKIDTSGLSGAYGQIMTDPQGIKLLVQEKDVAQAMELLKG